MAHIEIKKSSIMAGGEFRKNFDAARTEVKVGDGATATVSLASDTAPAGVTSPLGNEGARIAASPSPKQPFTTPSQDFRVTGVSMAKATKAPNELGADDAITSAALEAAVPNDFAAEVPVAAASDQGTPYAALLYKELTSLFGLPADGDGKQKLVMEFPGRVLDMQSYAYPVRDALSAMQKPQAVIEKEFQLCDVLFDTSNAVTTTDPTDASKEIKAFIGMPNGSKLSVEYEEALNLLVPKFDGKMSLLYKDQEKLRSFLLEPVPYFDRTDGGVISGVKVPKMYMFNKLNQIYTAAKSTWIKEKDEVLANAQHAGTPEAMERYSRFIAREGPVKQEHIESLYADLVIHGHYHSVMNALGFMDYTSESELLNRYKHQLRASGMGSLDESYTVYPVSFQPEDWFAALRTNFTPMDLLQSSEVIQQELRAKCILLDELSQQLAMLTANVMGDPTQLKEEVVRAQEALDSAHLNMQKQFSTAAIELFEMYEKQLQGGVGSQEDFDKWAGAESNLVKVDFEKLKQLQNQAMEAQHVLQSASRMLADKMMNYSLAQATNKGDSITKIKAQMNRLREDIDQLKNSPAIDKAEVNVHMFPSGDAPRVGRWMDIAITATGQTDAINTNTSANASNTQGGGAFWFMSGGWSNSSASSTASSNDSSKSVDIHLGFRATKVAFERGWFNPSVLSNNTSYNSLDPDRSNSLVTNYPVGMILAKDVTIKMVFTEAVTQDVTEVLDKSRNWNVGFLCFSASHTDSHHETSHNYFHKTDGTTLYIRIPGPQIIGWIVETRDVPGARHEVADKAKMTNYSPMPMDFLPVTLDSGALGLHTRF